jgi:acetyl-CoA acyltransferase
MRDAVLVAAVRSAVGKAPQGTLKDARPDELAAQVMRGALERTPGLDPGAVDDVVFGCALPEGEQGLNVARIASLRAGLPAAVPAATVNRFCASGLQAIAMGAEKIMAGFADVVIAGGTESMSLVPVPGTRFAPHPALAEQWPEVYLSMGLATEHLVKRFGISREAQDAYALQSHRRAAAAVGAGRFREEIVPITVRRWEDEDGVPRARLVTFAADEGVRFDANLEAMAKLPPAFARQGTVTAGNSSQTSDGAAACVVMSAERARLLGFRPLAAFRSFAVSGVPPELMGIGPVEAIRKAVRLAGIRLQDVDLIELNEAFAAQTLAVIRQLDLDAGRTNVNGGAIALGHPLGCTGAKLTATLLHEMLRRRARYGIVAMCVGGGMGAAAVFESEPQNQGGIS